MTISTLPARRSKQLCSHSLNTRELTTLRRLRTRFGMPALVQIIAEISEMPSTTRRVGAPRQKQTRAALLAAIYCLRRGSRQPSIREFSGEIARVLKIKYARTIGTGGPNWKEQSVAAIEQDLRRGLAP